MTQKIIAIIPARYASTRFPGKPLALIHQKPMIQHVWERAREVFDDVFVATDDTRIAQCVQGFGGIVLMTPVDLPSGTDRVAVAVEQLPFHPDVVINIQGDEPFIETEQLRQLAALFQDPNCDIATLVHPLHTMAEIEDPNCVKTVVGADNYALYFSRQPIPFLRGVDREKWAENHKFLKHIGLYGYRAEVLQKLRGLPQSPLETAESLEQLRWLGAGLKIKTALTQIQTQGVDTPQDLEKLQKTQ